MLSCTLKNRNEKPKKKKSKELLRSLEVPRKIVHICHYRSISLTEVPELPYLSISLTSLESV